MFYICFPSAFMFNEIWFLLLSLWIRMGKNRVLFLGPPDFCQAQWHTTKVSLEKDRIYTFILSLDHLKQKSIKSLSSDTNLVKQLCVTLQGWSITVWHQKRNHSCHYTRVHKLKWLFGLLDDEWEIQNYNVWLVQCQHSCCHLLSLRMRKTKLRANRLNIYH